MLKSLASFVIPAFALLFAGAAADQATASEFYAKVSVGSTMEAEAGGLALSEDLVFGGSVGATEFFGLPLRVEAGVNRLAADADFGFINVEGTAYDLYAGLYADFPLSERSALFIGGGADFMFANADVGPFSDDGNGSGYHGAIGISHNLNDRTIIEAQMRYVRSDGLDFGTVGKIDFESYVPMLGLRWRS